jgi:TonB-linked SusC/RagA family outer membrane protein
MKYLPTQFILVALIALLPLSMFPQSGDKFDLQVQVIGQDGNSIGNAKVESVEGDTAATDTLGVFRINVSTGTALTISASGYKTLRVIANDELERIEMVPGKNENVQIAYRKVNEGDLFGGISYVDVPEILEKNYTTYSLENLNAFVGGFNGASIWGMGNYLVLVDGIPRSAGSVMPTEIEQVTFLKGVTAVALYGSRAVQGVVLITTKHGTIGKQQINVRVDAGMYVPKRFPKYLGSGEYMTLYNEARANDGLSSLYDEETIYNYATGSNPYRYPSVNYYSSDYLNKVYSRYDAVLEISGGNDFAKYYTDVNFYRSGDILNFGEAQNNSTQRFNVRGNVDLKLNDFISATVGANAIYYSGRGVNTDYWNSAATTRPNRFSPLVPIDRISPDDDASQLLINNSSYLINDRYLLGGSQLDQTNSFAAIYAGGYNTYTSREFQFNTAVDADLSGLLKGLSFHTTFGVDYQTSYNQSYNNEYSVYQPNWTNFNGLDEIGSLTKYGQDSRTGIQNISNSAYRQTIAFSGQFNYDTNFDEDNHFSAMLVGAGWQQSESEVYHRTSNVNMGLNLSYDYRDKYFVQFNGAAVHSARLAEGERTAFSPSGTIGWKLSNEAFLENSEAINELKLSVSAGILHTDLNISDYYLYQSIYTQTDGAWYSWRDGALTKTTDSRRGENLDLTFAERKEINFEVDGSFFNNMLNVKTSFFANLMNGNVVQASVLYPNYFSTGWPNSSFIPYINYNNDKRVGFDFDVNINKKIGSVDWNLGVTGLYYDTEASQRAEVFEDDYQYREGKPLDGIWGLESNGFFMDENEITNSPTQAFGQIQPGDIKYVDKNGDGVVNDQDQVYLGKAGWSGAPFSFGVHISAKWKSWTFFALATGQTGAYAMKNNSYFWVDGEDKYSVVARDRWTPETANTATYPRLTTQNSNNNFRSSDFWLYSTDRVDLSKVQISYDIPSTFLGNTFDKLNIYATGSNLLTISSESEIMELNIGGAPQTRFYNLGVKALF